jgi:hypothetical protein
MSEVSLVRILQVVQAAVVITACAGCASNAPMAPSAVDASAFAFWQRLELRHGSGYIYVADTSLPGHVYVYALPLRDSSKPLWDIGDLDRPGPVGFDPGQVFVLVAGSTKGQGILVYEPMKRGPVSFVLPTPLLPEMAAVDAHGDLFQGQSYTAGSYAAYQINAYLSPITNNSAPAFTISAAVNHAGSTNTRGMAFDSNGNLWVKDDDNKTMDEYVPPFSSASTPALTFPEGTTAPFGSIVFDKHNTMFVSDENAGVAVYQPPFTKNTKKAFEIGAPVANILAVDSAGDLYVTSGTQVLFVYAPPFSASSKPIVTLPLPGSETLTFIGIHQ